MGVIMHKGIAYGGGSNVEANPAGSATDDLSKLGIDGTVYDITDADAVHSADIGVADGVASLDSNGKVPSAQLPTYPTVNNGTLTIQKNGTAVATFTANQSGNSTANISVPTQPSDINAAAESEIQSTKSTSGNPITITDAAPINAESLVVELEPQQDLHGYDYPWVGGAGKNKVAYPYTTAVSGTWNSMSISENDGLISVQGTQNGVGMFNFAEIPLKANVTYTLSTNFVYDDSTASGRSGRMALTVYDITNTALLANIYSGNASFTPSADCTARVYLNPSSGANNRFFKFTVKPQIEVGQTASAWQPYSNICPISGYDSVSVDDVGKNLFDDNGEVIVYNINTGGTQRAGYKKPLLAGTYTISAQNGDSGAYLDAVLYKDGEFTSIGRVVDTTTLHTFTFTIDTAKELRIFDAASAQTSIAERRIKAAKFQVEVGNQATTYEPYHSSNATIQFGQTVYGGTVDFKTGVVTITDANIASYAGETLPSTWISDRDAYSSGGTPTTGAQVVYKLSTPTTLQLTPAELKLLQNTNNITTNGTTITLGYQPNNVVGELKGDIETEHERFYTETAEYAVTFLNNARCVILATSSSDYIPIAAYTDYLFVAIGQIGDNYVGYIKFPDMSEPSESELPIGTEIEFTVVFMRKE